MGFTPAVGVLLSRSNAHMRNILTGRHGGSLLLEGTLEREGGRGGGQEQSRLVVVCEAEVSELEGLQENKPWQGSSQKLHKPLACTLEQENLQGGSCGKHWFSLC